MLDSLKRPRIDSTNSPICTSGQLTDTLRIYYMGPREQNVHYTLNLDSAGTILTFTGSTGAEDSLLKNITMPKIRLDTTNSPYPFQITLTYATGCTYTSRDTAFISSGPRIQAMGPVTFCGGQKVTLKASRGSSYSWRRAGQNSVIGTTQQLLVDKAGFIFA